MYYLLDDDNCKPIPYYIMILYNAKQIYFSISTASAAMYHRNYYMFIINVTISINFILTLFLFYKFVPLNTH